MGWILKCSGPAKHSVVRDTITLLQTDTVVVPKIIERTKYRVRVDSVIVKVTDTLLRVDTLKINLSRDFIKANLDTIIKIIGAPPVIEKTREIIEYQRYFVGLLSFDEVDYYTRRSSRIRLM